MTNYLYREATISDVSSLARLRAENSHDIQYWELRVLAYLSHASHPQKALDPRVVYVTLDSNKVVGFIAGHLTKRFECDGELQWIDISKDYRRKGIGSNLIQLLHTWFKKMNAFKICIDPGNQEARLFYLQNGATMLNNHWMYWEDISKK